MSSRKRRRPAKKADSRKRPTKRRKRTHRSDEQSTRRSPRLKRIGSGAPLPPTPVRRSSRLKKRKAPEPSIGVFMQDQTAQVVRQLSRHHLNPVVPGAIRCDIARARRLHAKHGDHLGFVPMPRTPGSSSRMYGPPVRARIPTQKESFVFKRTYFRGSEEYGVRTMCTGLIVSRSERFVASLSSHCVTVFSITSGSGKVPSSFSYEPLLKIRLGTRVVLGPDDPESPKARPYKVDKSNPRYDLYRGERMQIEPWCGVFSPDDRYLVLGVKRYSRSEYDDDSDECQFKDCPLYVYDLLECRKLLRTEGDPYMEYPAKIILTGHKEEVTVIRDTMFEGNYYLLTGSVDGYMRKWRIEPRTFSAVPPPPASSSSSSSSELSSEFADEYTLETVSDVKFLPNCGSLFAVSANDYFLDVVDFGSSKVIRSLVTGFRHSCTDIEVLSTMAPGHFVYDLALMGLDAAKQVGYPDKAAELLKPAYGKIIISRLDLSSGVPDLRILRVLAPRVRIVRPLGSTVPPHPLKVPVPTPLVGPIGDDEEADDESGISPPPPPPPPPPAAAAATAATAAPIVPPSGPYEVLSFSEIRDDFVGYGCCDEYATMCQMGNCLLVPSSVDRGGIFVVEPRSGKCLRWLRLPNCRAPRGMAVIGRKLMQSAVLLGTSDGMFEAWEFRPAAEKGIEARAETETLTLTKPKLT